MAALNLFHDAVKQALLNELWVITAEPLTIKIEGVRFEIDLAAEKVFAAEKAGRKIAVEVKSFLSNSALTDFQFQTELTGDRINCSGSCFSAGATSRWMTGVRSGC